MRSDWSGANSPTIVSLVTQAHKNRPAALLGGSAQNATVRFFRWALSECPLVIANTGPVELAFHQMKNKHNNNNPRRRKRPSAVAIRSAHAILDEMSKSGRQVHVMILLEPLIVMFESTVKKRESEGLEIYILTRPNLNMDISVTPELSDLIMFSDEGLLLGRRGVLVTLEPEERSAEELFAMYPGATKVIH